ncbi:MAG: YicC family protein [Desulfovibrionaceae bacterium]|nr:YicC family protein [Desulfovibrionaceae bacterium]
MLRSMTGFGRSLMETHDITQQWEIKSVNGRHLDIKWRLPNFLHGLEPRLEKIVRNNAQRGRVEITLYLQFADNAGPDVLFNESQAARMLDTLAAFAKKRNDTFTPDYSFLLSLPALWKDSSEDLAQILFTDLQEGLLLALDDWNESRTTEGKSLANDISSRILLMGQYVGVIRERAPSVKLERVDLLRERLHEGLALVGAELDEDRFLQEIVILSDRLDVTEELTRLATHFDRLHELLRLGEDAGRKLDFTLQECFREINTCGNKITDVQISHLVVDVKNELEKCREQVQNLE